MNFITKDNPMRRAALLLLFALALPAAAADKLPDLQPVPEPPPPPSVAEPSLEPQVTITKRGQDKVEEYRVNGKLYMLKVTPPGGVPYYLVDKDGNGTWVRDSRDSNLVVPQWVIHQF
jgi:hypothetical protein